MKKIALVYTTLDSLSHAQTLATQAIKEKVAACVNIIPTVISIYEWESKITNSQECIMIFKTPCEKTEELLQWLRRHHPYAIPAILSGEVNTLNDFYEFAKLAC